MLKRMNERGDMSFESWLQDQAGTPPPEEETATKRFSLAPRKSMMPSGQHHKLSTIDTGKHDNRRSVVGRPTVSKRGSQRKSMSYRDMGELDSDEQEEAQEKCSSVHSILKVNTWVKQKKAQMTTSKKKRASNTFSDVMKK